MNSPTANTIKKNSIYSFLTTFTRLITNFIVFWFLARFYGPEIFGQFTFSHTVATIFIFFADFGFDILLTTEVAKYKNHHQEIFSKLFRLKLLFIFVTTLMMLGFIYFVKVSIISKYLLSIFCVFLIFSSINNFLNAYFKGFEKLEYETKVSFYSNFSLLILVGIFIYLKLNVVFIAIMFSFSRIIGTYFAIKYIKLINDFNFNITTKPNLSFRNSIAIYGAHYIFNFIYFNIDTVLIALLLNEKSVGLYQAVFKIIALLLIIPEIINNVMLPTLSRLNVENIDLWKGVGNMMQKILLIIGIPLSLICIINADSIINIIYGINNYRESVQILRVFGFVVLLRFLLEPYGMILTTKNRQEIRTYTVIFVTIFNVIANLIFLPLYGIIASAYISLISNFIILAVYMLYNIEFVKEVIIRFTTFFLFIVALFLVIINKLYNINLLLNLIAVVVIYLFFGIKYFFTNQELEILLPVKIYKLFKK